ncbi:hypothetical protein HMF3257_39050 [Spirosoma telluris]|uniref:Uncharacterized protein n=1 Tax=Spirosoma telluris TaxID=2183553 RepID=A0A327ND77_9BACT|nr:hypothetical protein HMF3257_39050 [Spirosoma telluris]
MSAALIKYYKEFEVKKDIVSFIKFFSVSTWQKIGFVRSKDRLKMHETTITQNLLFLFQLLSDQYPQAVQMFESKDEMARGNDIEIFIKMSRVT